MGFTGEEIYLSCTLVYLYLWTLVRALTAAGCTIPTPQERTRANNMWLWPKLVRSSSRLPRRHRSQWLLQSLWQALLVSCSLQPASKKVHIVRPSRGTGNHEATEEITMIFPLVLFRGLYKHANRSYSSIVHQMIHC
ncbi:hypothetical protein TorRG33x02_085590 [Trema orientale]|uniref:Uncharacterized protein n=1 Tax=Trema orientale TaxID=63057 RepID=A0A2P5FD57_TREOI|nr:hypothetical protein TorRG33x02_085590 [Trema orientale]